MATQDMQFSVLGIGAAFVDLECAEELGFSGCDMSSDLLNPRMRRRMSEATKLAISAGERACVDAHVDVDTLPSVFASIAGEIKVTDKLCRAISQRELPVSPTQFHNSVHNTAAGYWSIMSKSKHAAQAIGANENTFYAGLLESVCQLNITADKVLLVCYEEPAPAPLYDGKQEAGYAIAVVLGQKESDAGRLVSLSQNLNQQDSTETWSAVHKALQFIQMMNQGNKTHVLVSDVASGWEAKRYEFS